MMALTYLRQRPCVQLISNTDIVNGRSPVVKCRTVRCYYLKRNWPFSSGHLTTDCYESPDCPGHGKEHRIPDDGYFYLLTSSFTKADLFLSKVQHALLSVGIEGIN